MDTKFEVRSKPTLSPTRSLDEGFESDPDRISTDSESSSSSSSLVSTSIPSFDLHQRTDRDGVQHTQITRRHNNNNNSNNNSLNSNSSIDYSVQKTVISLQVKSSSDNNKTDKLSIPRATNNNNNNLTRRPKTKAPQPPSSPSNRSHSVDILRSRDLDFNRGSSGDILSGKFVRVTVDPRHSRMMRPSQSMYTVYPINGNATMQIYPLKQSGSYGLAVNKPNKNQQHHMPPICWTQSIPRQTRR